jgi:hypothetical protein
VNRIGLSFLAKSSLLVISLLIFSDQTAHAYIDPGTGSFVLQGILGGLFAGAFMFKLWWGRFTGVLRSVRRTVARSRDDDDE